MHLKLLKTIIKAIMHLEDAGAEVVGLITYDTTTNRTLWKYLFRSRKGSLKNFF